MRFFRTTLVLAVIVIGGAIAYAYSGHYDVSVGTGHNAVTQWFLATLRENSIERRADQLEVPPLDDAEMIRAGAIAYDQSCSGCHGRPGREASTSFDPRPPALTRYEHGPADVFWVVRNGIKMSAMPARGEDRMSDEEVWQVAAFLQTASGLTQGEYRQMVEPTPEPVPEPEPAEADSAEPTQGDDAAVAEEAGDEPEQATEAEDQPAEPAAEEDSDG